MKCGSNIGEAMGGVATEDEIRAVRREGKGSGRTGKMGDVGGMERESGRRRSQGGDMANVRREDERSVAGARGDVDNLEGREKTAVNSN